MKYTMIDVTEGVKYETNERKEAYDIVESLVDNGREFEYVVEDDVYFIQFIQEITETENEPVQIDWDCSTCMDAMVEMGVATNDEVMLVTNLNGWKMETMSDILYVRTGYDDFNEWYNDTI